ncbi:hypothetical protein ACV33G_33540, partial [Pseudomonas aeruginosa]
CSLVMLGVNAVLFFTGLLERADPRRVLACGMVLGIAGLLMLARHGSEVGQGGEHETRARSRETHADVQ